MPQRNERTTAGWTWGHWLILLLSSIFAAFFFVQCFDWGLGYSKRPPGPSSDIELRNTWLFFLLFAVFESLSARTAAVLLWEPDLDSAPLRLLARYGGGLMISLFATAVLVTTWIGITGGLGLFR